MTKTKTISRLSTTNPGCKVTIQQDFFMVRGAKSFPKMRRKSMEMYKPQSWTDITNYNFSRNLAGTVMKINVEVSAVDVEVRYLWV